MKLLSLAYRHQDRQRSPSYLLVERSSYHRIPIANHRIATIGWSARFAAGIKFWTISRWFVLIAIVSGHIVDVRRWTSMDVHCNRLLQWSIGWSLGDRAHRFIRTRPSASLMAAEYRIVVWPWHSAPLITEQDREPKKFKPISWGFT